MNGRKIILQFFFPSLLILTFFGAIGRGGIIMPLSVYGEYAYAIDSNKTDSFKLKYPIKDRKEDFITNEYNNPFDLEDPLVIEQNVDYDPVTEEFIITEKIGEDYYRNPNYLSFEEFLEEEFSSSEKKYWIQRVKAESLLERKGIVPKLHMSSSILDRIFGGSTVDIRPQGTINLTFGGQFSSYANPLLPEKSRRTGGFDFDMDIQMNVVGKIGEKLKVTTNYNTKATFDFENQFKLEYTGFEDEIIQKIEAGNVSLPLKGTLITGSQSLFGIKTELKFGRLKVTSIFTQQKGEVKEIEIQGGAQTQTFEIEAQHYDANRHFFLSHYFRDNYDRALSTLPIINSPVTVTRIEVWITNFSGATENTRDIVAFMDLGESDPAKINNATVVIDSPGSLPNNYANNIYRSLKPSKPSNRNSGTIIQNLTNYPTFPVDFETPRDFEKIYARRLSENEYTFNQEQQSLGYISLNQSLNPEDVLAVAFEITTATGDIYTVGEFSSEVPPGENNSSVLFLKMLKSSSTSPKYPLWDLMMKNIYSLGAYQVNSEDFQLDINYLDPGGGKRRYIPEGTGVKGIPLIRLLNLDNLNTANDPSPDGVFDFVSGITIFPSNGKVVFPVVEPFGSYLNSKFNTISEKEIAKKYVYNQLYDSTITIAEQFPELNRYTLEGSYKSSVSSEISLGFNISPGSVKVTAGGQQLSEGNDYIVDYSLGRIKIINEAYLNTGIPVKISFEDKALFGIQTKSLFGTRLDYWISDDFTLGGTFLHLSERPFTNKVNIGDEPISNGIWGVDGSYHTEAPWLTKMIDKLPFISTKEPSSITITGEFAKLEPGHSKIINNKDNDEKGVAYLDHFEGTEISYRLELPYLDWSLASTPKNTIGRNGDILFPEAALIDSLDYGFNRAKICWYSIDPIFLRSTSGAPDISDDEKSNHYVREIRETEVFPNKENANQITATIPIFDIAFYPDERGPYNYDFTNVASNGTLLNPRKRWGGIMRKLPTTDFEAANIEFIEFWLMDPFITGDNGGNNSSGGEMYIQLGNISEDILKDSKKFFENGLPKANSTVVVDTTVWGRVPISQPIVEAFDPNDIEAQDVGFDGLNDAGERSHFDSYLTKMQALVSLGSLSQSAYDAAYADPSTDDYQYYKGDDHDAVNRSILGRYKKYNNAEGNSRTPSQGESTAAKLSPDSEDLNKDNTLSESEEYFQYNLHLVESEMKTGKNFIVDEQISTVTLENGDQEDVSWFQFRIPINSYNNKTGNINDFRSIRFIRLLLTDFQEDVVLRFARFELIRNQWKRYHFSLQLPGEYVPDDNEGVTEFDVSSVNVEENTDRTPVNYVLPPAIQREQLVGSVNNYFQNEQALSVKVCNLKDGDSRAVYKILNKDIRNFKKIKMYIHAEADEAVGNLENNQLKAFIRIGSDFISNYYEYEIPLKITPKGTYSSNSENDREIVWPASNNLDIEIQKLIDVKIDRNNNKNYAPHQPYVKSDNGNVITVLGNPDLGQAKVVMLGIRNPRAIGPLTGVEDGEAKCAEVWFNELRLTDFEEKGGWAALARVDVKLADLGKLTLSGNMYTIGFGALEENISERSLENFHQYDAALNLELGKFFPKKAGLIVPTYASYSKSISTPKYDPYDSDVLLRIRLNAANPDDRDSIKSITQDVTTIRSLNFTNVKKISMKQKKRRMFYDIDNFSVTYAYTDIQRSNPTIESENEKRYKVGLNYGFQTNPIFVSPFKKLIGSNRKHLALVKQFNFGLMPSGYSFRTEFNRKFGTTLLRRKNADDLPMEPTYDKSFTWDRTYGLNWNLSKSIKLDFSATNRARIDEPKGLIDTKEKRDTIVENIKNFGRTTNYTHNINLGYNVPLKAIKALDWTQLRATYSATYDWTTSPYQGINIDTIGNTVNNSQNNQIQGNLNMKKFYKKFKFLKKYTDTRSRRKQPPTKGKGKVEDEKKSKGKKKNKKGKKDKSEKKPITDSFIKLLLSLKKVSINFSEGKGTILPGYKPKTDYFGMEYGGIYAPGYEFLVGYQPDHEWLKDKTAHSMLITSPFLSYQLAQNHNTSYNIKASLEPLKDMRVDLNASRNFSQRFSEYFQIIKNEYIAKNRTETGSFDISFIAINTMFDKPDKDGDRLTKAFREYESNRVKFSKRLGENNPNSYLLSTPDSITGERYYYGYGPYSQDVLIPSFVAAYTGKDIDDAPLSLKELFKMRPKPNWRITYNGLSKLKIFENLMQSINLTHAYTSSFRVGSYRSNLFYRETNGYVSKIDTISRNFEVEKVVQQIIISEQLSPLLGVDIEWKNKISTRLDYKRTRKISVSFIDYQLSETKTNELTIGIGYRLQGVALPFGIGGKNAKLNNDLNCILDFSILNNKSVKYILDQNIAEPTSGNTTIRVSPSIDYSINNRLNIRLFYDRQDNIPATSASYRRTNTKAGINIRFTLSN